MIRFTLVHEGRPMRRFERIADYVPAMLSPMRPLDALRAFRGILNDPDDTAQVFRIIEALEGPHPAYMLWRFRRHPDSARLLRERPRLLPHLVDRDALAALPEGSLGRAYLAFCSAEGITPDGLVAASQQAARDRRGAGVDDLAYIYDRLRDAHDLWHVVTGYRGDLIGEGALLAFSFAQTHTPGIALVVTGGWFKLAAHPDRDQFIKGFQRGLRSAWLPAVHWETLLARPLDEVRARLRVGPPPAYAPLRTDDAPSAS
jgi:ubiquinone biosynthesis protein COQ4